VKRCLNQAAGIFGLGIFLLVLGGCSAFVPTPYVQPTYVLDGKTSVEQSGHTVWLSLWGEMYGESPGKGFRLEAMEAGQSVPVDSAEGTYQYYSEAPQPLEVTLTPQEIALIPQAEIVTKLSSKRTEKIGELRHGRYRLDIKYRIHRYDYECHFDVVYKIKNEAGVAGPWDWKDIN
jgi:hypothetical protein